MISETCCWKCNTYYNREWVQCPKCEATNACFDLEKAQTEMTNTPLFTQEEAKELADAHIGIIATDADWYALVNAAGHAAIKKRDQELGVVEPEIVMYANRHGPGATWHETEERVFADHDDYHESWEWAGLITLESHRQATAVARAEIEQLKLNATVCVNDYSQLEAKLAELEAQEPVAWLTDDLQQVHVNDGISTIPVYLAAGAAPQGGKV